MPPKTPQKPKATPETPGSEVKPKATPKKKEPVPITTVERGGKAPLPVDVTFEGTSAESKIAKTGRYQHSLKLDANATFTVVKTVVLEDGEFKDFQAILIRPAKAFPFLQLPKEARKRIYGYYFAPKGVMNKEIGLDGKRKESREVYAKTYAESSKDRVALLAVNREIYDEAISIFYANTLLFENTTTLMEFLANIQATTRPLLQSVMIKAYVKTSSRNALHFLAEARNLQKLKIQTGISSDGEPVKSAKSFYADAYKFLETRGSIRKDKAAGLNMITFSKSAFKRKDPKKGDDMVPWTEAMITEFLNELRKRTKMAQNSGWVCICGSRSGSHICVEIFKWQAENAKKFRLVNA